MKRRYNEPPGYLAVTTHHLKTHLAHYLRALENGQYKAIVVKRYNKTVGLLFNPQKGKNEKNVD